MKFTCLTSNLKKALNVCEKITNRNLSLPILNNILIKTFKNQLQLVSTDLELGLNYFVNGEVIEEGEIIIPAKLLLGLISNLKEEKITLETKKDKLYIQTKDFDLNIQGFDSTDFPIIPKIKSEDYLEIESQEFLKTLSQVIKSANAGFNKPELNSVYFHYNKENMFFVSTDSFRLSEKQLNKSSYKFNGDQEIKMIVPIKTINEVMLILQNFEDINDKVKVFFSNNQIFFDFGSVNLISRLIEGEFPNYKNIIPKNFQTKIQIDKNNLIESIKLISLLSSQIKDINIQ
ncbi:MAG TPA: DNA polymerase III subunit beta, partial [Candidatus Paceibacterota bacterium]|nr:DNA polymerase III subunit beta [Candidatus Paceibacterota bacterium]